MQKSYASLGKQTPTKRIIPHDSTKPDLRPALAILKIGGIELDDWQQLILSDWLSIGDNGSWSSSFCGGSVPRQNGKSLLVQARAEVGMFLYKETVIYTAHLQKTATETFNEMRSFFEHKQMLKYVKEIKQAIGREEITLKNGARIKFLARTRNGGRGQHGDLIIFDEAQELDVDEQTSFIPAISASRNPQTIYVGTPPDETVTATVFRNLRDKALNGNTTKMSWFEFSVDKIGDVLNKKRWADTNPALGKRIQIATVESEAEQFEPDKFARERLGWWSPIVSDEDEKAIDPEKWEKCASKQMKPDGKTAYGVKFSPDGAEVCLCGAVIPEEGKARISFIKRESTSEGLRWLADWLNERYMNACCVVIDGKNGPDVLIDKIHDTWKHKKSIVRPRVKDVLAAVSLLTDAVNEQTVTWYKYQDALDESARTSVKRPIAGGWGFGGEDSAPIEACSLALWGANTSKRDPKRKMRIG